MNTIKKQYLYAKSFFMTTEIIRGRLHEYIDRADNEHIAAMYVLLEQQIESGFNYSDEVLAMLYQRVANDEAGSRASYSAQEALDFVRSHKTSH